MSRDKRMFLSMLWIFVTFNYLFCDVMGLMDSGMLKKYLAGNMDGIVLSQNFFLLSALLMEIPMSMIIFSRILNHRSNRIANIVAGSIMTVVQLATLLIGTFTYYYAFFSLIEIVTTGFIVWLAVNWKRPSSVKPLEGDNEY